MKNINIALSLLIFSSLLACNKDDEIIGEPPGNITGDEETDNAAQLIYDVLEYTPAPGQFINEEISGFANINSSSKACQQAEKRLKENQYVSLGAWGGYIIIRLEQPIINSGSFDFAIGSNAFDSSNEPGIVWVMPDDNDNGLADEEWYELKGSFFGFPGYERDYWIKYFRGEAKSDILWIDSKGDEGWVKWMGNQHPQESYFPAWIDAESITFYGSRLPNRAIQNDLTGQWQNEPFEWGYADNCGSDFFKDGNKNLFKISNAITADNKPAVLKEIRFIKVQTAVNGSAGILGENSTEVSGFYPVNQ